MPAQARNQREWDALPQGNRLRGKKVITAETTEQLLAAYALTEPYQPRVVVQEIIVGPDAAKYCHLSVYGSEGAALGSCVVKEYRCSPIYWGSATVVEAVEDPEITATCDAFLRRMNYVGLCEIELKRDARDGLSG